MGMILRIASSRIVGQGDIVGRSGYFSLNLSANSVMRGRLDARRTLKSLVADLRLTNNIWILAVILYFLGIINSRISSLVFEPLIKMLKIVKFVPHKDFTDAELKDTSGKLTQLSRMNNEYRSYISVFSIVLIIKLIFLFSNIKNFITDNICWIILCLGVLLFLCAYRKQVSYITSRISRLNNQ